jgi:excisionase family DNA binding protein
MVVRKSDVRPLVADDTEAVIARTAAERLKRMIEADDGREIVIEHTGGEASPVPIPSRAAGLILELLAAMGDQTPVSVVPHDTELTTQQAADFLKLSRPYLIQRIENGDLPARKVGSHRRVRFSDLIAYQKALDQRQLTALAELNNEAHRLGLE